MDSKKAVHPVLIVVFFVVTSIIPSSVLRIYPVMWGPDGTLYWSAILVQICYIGLFACLVTYLLGWSKQQWKNRLKDVFLWGILLRVGLDAIFVTMSAFYLQEDVPEIVIVLAPFFFNYLWVLVLCIRVYFFTDARMHFRELPKDERKVTWCLLIISFAVMAIYIWANVYVWILESRPRPLEALGEVFIGSLADLLFGRFRIVAEILLLPLLMILFDRLPKKDAVAQAPL